MAFLKRGKKLVQVFTLDYPRFDVFLVCWMFVVDEIRICCKIMYIYIVLYSLIR